MNAANAPCGGYPTAERGDTLHRRVRAALLLQGVTLKDWCAANGVSRQYAYQCMTGRRRGPTARRLVIQLTEAGQLAQ
jgi:hypothetical protein